MEKSANFSNFLKMSIPYQAACTVAAMCLSEDYRLEMF